ncbi:GTP-binding protein 10-like [Babylonia areolata]|uniref:GTP-binding protein 10-like n=1 Tax=Babylonia areolata TaxID=304850 RepID=UPI003FD54699
MCNSYKHIQLAMRCQNFVSSTQRRLMGSFRRSGANEKGENDYVPDKNYVPNKKKFIDSLRIYVRGGAGGQGLPKYGGIGGKGGDIVVVCEKKQTLVNMYRRYPSRRFVAGSGGNCTKFSLCGEEGEDVELKVPPGVEVLTDEGHLLGDANEEGDRVIAAHGGQGGNPNNQFIGRRGEARSVRLNLKLIADVGLVGFPNAGKSTFLKAVSRAKPKIANYPFTTIRPQIGIVEFPDFRKISVADLPGLIEGAHANFGMGHRFLKHVERTKLLLFVVDVNGFQLAQDYPMRSAFQTVILLNKELELYQPDLLDKPALLVLNKSDTDPDGRLEGEVMSQLEDLPVSMDTIDSELRPDTLMKFDDVLTMSAMKRENTDDVMRKVRGLLDDYADKQLAEQQKDQALVLADDNQGGVMQQHREHMGSKLV